MRVRKTRKLLEIPSCENCTSRATSVFCNLKEEDQKALAASKGCMRYLKGQDIFIEGARPTGVYCIYEGKVKVHKVRGIGKTQIVRLAKKGDILGYRSLISGGTYTSSATALEDAQVCYIPKNVFLDLLLKSGDFALKIMYLFAHELQHAEEKITSLAQKPVRERLAETLILLKDFYGLKDDNSTLDVTITREDLASITGTSTETVVRLLSELKDDKIVALNKKAIMILDMKRLFHIAHLYD